MLRKISAIKVIAFLFVLILGIFAIFILKLWHLQVNKNSEFQRVVIKQNLRVIRVEPIRGNIFTSDNKCVAKSIPVYNIEVFPSEIRQRSRTSKEHTLAFVKRVLFRLNSIKKIKNFPTIKNLKEVVYKGKALHIQLYAVVIEQFQKIIQENSFLEVIQGSLFFNSKKIPQLDKQSAREHTASHIFSIAKDLSYKINIKVKITEKDIYKHLYRTPTLSLKILENLSHNQALLLREILPEYPQLQVSLSFSRYYPLSPLASQLIGSVGKKQTTKEVLRSYSFFPSELYGIRGIELFYDDILKGEGGRETVQIDSNGYINKKQHKYFKKISRLDKKSINGKKIILTINYQAQKIADELLKGKRGALVCVDITNGDIVAMASAPNFDSNRIRGLKYYQQMKEINNNRPWVFHDSALVNKALQLYVPGSVIKPFIALSALKSLENFFPEKSYLCKGYYIFRDGTKIRCSAHRYITRVDMYTAIEVSCNSYFCHFAQKLGIDKINEIFYPLGFGYPIIGTGEKPYPQEKLTPVLGGGQWNSTETVFASIGQGKILISPLHLTMMVAALANGGTYYKAKIIQEVISDDNVRKKFPVFALSKINLSEYLEKVKRAMRKVFSGSTGTASHSRLKSFPLAGKTGTAQVPYYTTIKDEDGNEILNPKNNKAIIEKKIFRNTWFTGFAPYDNPRYAITVLVLGGKSGGQTAAPIAKKFFKRWKVQGK